MKKFFTLFLPVFLCLQVSFAQSSDKDITEALDVTRAYYENLDKSRTETGFLMDLAPPLENIDFVNGKSSDTLIANMTHFGLLYAMCMSAQTDAAEPLPLPQRTYRERMRNLSDGDAVPIAVLLHKYDRLKETAGTNNLIQNLNGQLYDGPDYSTSPYEQDTVFIAAGLAYEFSDLKAEFTFDPTQILGNMSREVSVLEIDFEGNGNFKELLPNTTQSTVYDKPGVHLVTVRAVLSNGISLSNRIAVSVTSPKNNLLKNYSETPINHSVSGLDEFGDDAEATINVFYADETCGMNKPLIVVEGFNPDGFNNVDFMAMFNLFSRDYQNPTGNNLITELKNGGYDLVYVDFTNGGARLENQAAAVEAAIEKVNELKNANGSYLPNTILGRSAGGTLARYALLQMQNRGDDHQTELFVSFDSPFVGGNIPLGVQFLVKDLADLQIQSNPFPQTLRSAVAVVDGVADALESDAAQQLLFYNAYDDSPLHNQMHDAFFQKFYALGDLHSVTHLAMANGSIDGEQINFDLDSESDSDPVPAGSVMLEAEGNLQRLLSGLGFFVDLFNLGEDIFGPGSDTPDIEGFDFTVFTLPDGAVGTEPVCDIYVELELEDGPTITLDNTHTAPAGSEAWDIVPGGTQGVGAKTLVNIADGLDVLDLKFRWFSHEPVISTFGLTSYSGNLLNTNYEYLENIPSANNGIADYYVGNINGYEEFDNDGDFVAYHHNQQHVTFHPRNATVFLFHLNKKSTPDFSGPAITLLENNTYNFGRLLAGGNYGETAAQHSDFYYGVGGNENFSATCNFIESDIDVGSNGFLKVNHAGELGFAGNTGKYNASNNNFILTIGTSGCTGSSAVVRVNNGGEFLIGDMNTDNTATVNITDGSSVIVGNGGYLEVDEKSRLIIQEGGELILRTGSELDLKRGAQILVKPGGKITIEDNTDIELTHADYTDSDGVARAGSHIYIQGEADLGGNIELPTGSGYFRFGETHTLTLAAGVGFDFKGHNPNINTLRIDENTTMNIGAHPLRIDRALVTMDAGSHFEVKNGAVNLFFSRFENTEPGTAQVLQGLGLTDFRASFSFFEGFRRNFEIQNMDEGADFRIYNCRFEDFTSSAVVVNDIAPVMMISGCNFQAQSAEQVFDLEQVLYCRIAGSTIQANFNDDEIIHIGALFGTLELANTDIFDASLAINDPDDVSIIGGSHHILLTKDSRITNCTEAIKQQGTPDVGIVTADCARFVDNGIAVKGRDIELNIDAYNNCDGECTESQINSNTFLKAPGGTLFDICYSNSIRGPIPARGNYWGGGTPPANDYDISADDTSTSPGTSCSIDIGMIFQNFDGTQGAVAALPTGCNGGDGGNDNPSPNDPQDEIELVYQQCNLNQNGQMTQVHKQFEGGYQKLKDMFEEVPLSQYFDDGEDLTGTVQQPGDIAELYLEGSLEVAIPDFGPVSAVDDATRDNSTGQCQQYIDISRKLVKMSELMRREQRPNGAWNENTLSDIRDTRGLLMYPNPARDVFEFSLPATQYRLQVSDLRGTVVVERASEGTEVIDVQGWSPGVYFVSVLQMQTGEKQEGKLVVAR